jgi:hypothetical protein
MTVLCRMQTSLMVSYVLADTIVVYLLLSRFTLQVKAV